MINRIWHTLISYQSSTQHKRCINTLRPGQNGRHFADDIFKCIFISLKFVPKGPINNIPALVQIMVGADQATSHYLNQWWLVHCRIYASFGLNELKKTLCNFFHLTIWFHHISVVAIAYIPGMFRGQKHPWEISTFWGNTVIELIAMELGVGGWVAWLGV